MSEDQLTFLTASLKENDEVDEKRIYLFDSMSGAWYVIKIQFRIIIVKI